MTHMQIEEVMIFSHTKNLYEVKELLAKAKSILCAKDLYCMIVLKQAAYLHFPLRLP